MIVRTQVFQIAPIHTKEKLFIASESESSPELKKSKVLTLLFVSSAKEKRQLIIKIRTSN